MSVNSKGHRFKLCTDVAGEGRNSRAELVVPVEERPVVISLPAPPELRFPGSLISVENVGFRYSRSTSAINKDINFTVGMGDRIGILGLNGAGKSTLIKLLVEEISPMTGSISTHPRLKMGYYSQHAVDALQTLGKQDPALNALALITKEVNGELLEGDIRGLLGELGLPGRLARDVPIAKLSGGQLVRCELARLLWRRPHLLILDEITTHLDYETVTALRGALKWWEGAVVLVGHDRWFMRGVIDGVVDKDEVESEGSDEDEPLRRRVMYRLKDGELSILKDGVDEFEALMEKRAKKLLDV